MNYKIDDKIKKLQQDVVIPDIVWEKAGEAFSQIKGSQVTVPTLPAIRETPAKRSHKKAWATAAAAGLFILGTTVFFAANPALASQLPIIGRIFSQVEKNSTFSGDYSSKADILANPDASPDFSASEEEDFSSETPGDGFEAEGETDAVSSTYTVSDNQMTVTASEIYCDGLSIYLTLLVEYEGDFGEIPSIYTSGTIDGDSTTAQYFYTFGEWSVNGEGPVPLENNYLEGTQLDASTFTGMMRLDLNRFPQVTDVTSLDLSMNRLGADNLEIDSTQLEDIGPMLLVDGTWNFTFPITADTSELRTVTVNDSGDNGYGVSTVALSPYELRVETLYPDGSDTPEVAAFTQDGIRLQPEEGILGITTFPVQENEISSLHIYVGTDGFFDLTKAQTMEEAASLCYYETTVDFQ